MIEQDRAVVLEILADGQDHLLEMHLAKGSRVARKNAVARWRAFCHILSLSPIIENVQDSLSLRMFVYFLGAAWVNYRSSNEDKRGLSHRYVASLLSSVRQWHLDEGYVNPLEFDKITSKVLVGLRRVTGDSYAPVLPVSKLALQFIIMKLKARKTPRATTLAATIATMFSFLLRISEVAETSTKNGLDAAYLQQGRVAFTVEGTGRDTEHYVNIGLRDTKSEAFKIVELKLPSVRRNDCYSTMFHICEQNKKLARDRGYTAQQEQAMPFFNVNGVPLQRADIADTIKDILSSPDAPEGLPDPSKFSTHSLRKGGATELLRVQVDVATIKWLGRWKSMAWMLYANVTDDCVKRAGRALANALF